MERPIALTGIAAAGMIFMTVLTGCVSRSEVKVTRADTEEVSGYSQNRTVDLTMELEALCREHYEQSIENRTLGSYSTTGTLVELLEQAGYAVIDQDNQFNLGNPELIKAFCSKVEEKQEADVQLLMVLNNGCFVQFHLSTMEGQVDVTASSLSWRGERLVNIDTDRYPASSWIYDENGYLFFDKYYMPGFDGPYDHVAVRVEPLPDDCRAFNRTYLLPLGYRSNNLFLTDWNEQDYGSLNWYDLFEGFYELTYPDRVPYSAVSPGEISQIPQEEFEEVIKRRFAVSSQVLQEKAIYTAASRTYEYRPRSVYDGGVGGAVAYPEVTGYETRDDGTIELTVKAVWPEMSQEAAFSHQVVVRPMPDGNYQYVSNQVLSSDDDVQPQWYVERLTEEQWEEFYGTQE